MRTKVLYINIVPSASGYVYCRGIAQDVPPDAEAGRGTASSAWRLIEANVNCLRTAGRHLRSPKSRRLPFAARLARSWCVKLVCPRAH